MTEKARKVLSRLFPGLPPFWGGVLLGTAMGILTLAVVVLWSLA